MCHQQHFTAVPYCSDAASCSRLLWLDMAYEVIKGHLLCCYCTLSSDKLLYC